MAIEYKRRLFTIREFEKLYRVGILREGDRIELIEGELVEMSPIGPRHDWATARVNRLLTTRFAEPFAVGIQGSLRLQLRSMPQPDGVVLQPEALWRGRIVTPADVLLVVEVADSSLRYDRLVKAPLYAKYGMTEYWIIDCDDDAVEVYRDPGPEGYATFTRASRGERIATEALPGEPPLVDFFFDPPPTLSP